MNLTIINERKKLFQHYNSNYFRFQPMLKKIKENIFYLQKVKEFFCHCRWIFLVNDNSVCRDSIYMPFSKITWDRRKKRTSRFDQTHTL